MNDNYDVYTAGPMDYFQGYVHISRISDHIKDHIRNYPMNDRTFHEIWNSILSKLYWAWTKCPGLDLELRSPDFWVRFVDDENSLNDFALVFKCDNNGTMIAIVNKMFDVERFVQDHLIHDFGCVWEKDENAHGSKTK